MSPEPPMHLIDRLLWSVVPRFAGYVLIIVALMVVGYATTFLFGASPTWWDHSITLAAFVASVGGIWVAHCSRMRWLAWKRWADSLTLAGRIQHRNYLRMRHTGWRR